MSTIANNEYKILFESLLNHATIGFGFFDRDLKYVHLNQALAAMNQRPLADHIGKTIHEVLPFAHVIAPILEQVFTTGRQVNNIEIPGQLNTPLPSDRAWVCHFYPIKDTSHVVYVGVAVIEITEQKQSEAALRWAMTQAEAASRAKSAILTNMSHELRTPLTNMIGYASLLSRRLEGRMRTQAERIVRGGKRLADTLNSVLMLAQLETGQLDPNLQALDVAACVQELAIEYAAQAAEQGIEFQVVVAPNVQGNALWIDQECFTMILNQVLSNALKFTRQGQIILEVSRQTTPAATIQIAIKDSGVGIEAAFLAHMFEPFRQESSGLNRSYEGMGLGLAVVKQLIERFHGTIEITSTKHVGTHVCMQFPLTTPADQAIVQPQAQRPAILVVEDSLTTGELIAEILLELGEVYWVTTATEALTLARRYVQLCGKPFEAILLDINLRSALSGIDVYQQLRTLPAYATVPIAAVTAYALPDQRASLLDQGFSYFLPKPFEPTELEQLVTTMLNSGT